MYELGPFQFGPADPGQVIECSADAGCMTTYSIIAALIIFVVLLTGFAYTTVLERRLIAWLQDRIGPNRAGPYGLLQPIADAVKLIFKQDVRPVGSDRMVYWVAPMIKVVPAWIILAVVPLAAPFTMPWFNGNWYRVQPGLADVNVGVLWITAVASISVYGVTMAGWASNNKYAMLGALRSAASMISYELSLGAAFVVAAMLAGSLSVGDIINAQSGSILNWFIFKNPLAAGIMFVALMAEINRGPFDLPEAEQELVAGHMTEYSGMKFAMFFLAEYTNMIGISVIFTSMYLGGYHLFLTDAIPLLGFVWLAVKVIMLLSVIIWIRATVPRIRYDRLMALGWKIMLPLSLLAIVWTGVVVVVAEESGSQSIYTLTSIALFILLGLIGLIFTPPSRLRPAKADVTVTAVPGKQTSSSIALDAMGSLVAAPMLLTRSIRSTIKNLAAFVRPRRASAEEQAGQQEKGKV